MVAPEYFNRSPFVDLCFFQRSSLIGAIIPGPGTPVSGSVGSLTYSRNRYGAYVRNRTKPINPNSPRQNSARAAFRNAQQSWVTNIQGTANQGLWEAYASNVPWLNSAGESIHLSAQAHYIRYYSAVVAATGATPATLTPPTIFDLGFLDATLTTPLTSDGTTLEATIGSVLISNTWAATGGRLLVEISLPKNQGATFAGPKWQSAAVITGAGTATHPLAITISLIDFPPVNDQQVWLRVRGIGVIATDRRVSTQQILGPFVIEAA